MATVTGKACSVSFLLSYEKHILTETQIFCELEYSHSDRLKHFGHMSVARETQMNLC